MELLGLPPIPVFDGTTRFTKWLEDFDAHCSARKWDTEARSERLSLFLTGNAAASFKQLSTAHKASYEAISNALKIALDPATPIMIQQSESITIARRTTETV